MEYYKVKPEFDNKTLWHNGKYKGFLIANELFTERELVKKNILFCYGVDSYMFDLVNIPKNKTGFFFGARFDRGVA